MDDSTVIIPDPDKSSLETASEVPTDLQVQQVRMASEIYKDISKLLQDCTYSGRDARRVAMAIDHLNRLVEQMGKDIKVLEAKARAEVEAAKEAKKAPKEVTEDATAS